MTEVKPTIAFIDDEVGYSMRYVRELLNKFDTHYFNGADEGLSFCDGYPSLRCLVVDVMMPPPDDVDLEDVNDGLETGIWFLEQLQTQLIRERTAIVVLTNRNIALVEKCHAQIRIFEAIY